MRPGNKIRLILDTPRRAVFNMAADEVLMELQRDPQAIPTLRIYFWQSPAASIGYFQDVRAVARRFEADKKNYEIVRRVTGGGLVLHGEDLTFSLVLKNENLFLPADVKMSYRKVNQALREGLGQIYPDLGYADCETSPSGRGSNQRICFEQPTCYDLMLGNQKVAGSSQRRKDGVILHHCAVFLKNSRWALTSAILKGFRKSWDIQFDEMPFTAEELERIAQKEFERRMSPEWGQTIN